MELFSYFRSTAAYRVRIALNLKGLDYQLIPVDLAGGEQRGADYLALNPQGLVPALRLDDGQVISQSTAIIEWLEETCPSPALLPGGSTERALIRGWVNTIACDIHPLNNLRVLNYLKNTLALDETAKTTWYHHWLQLGFEALEQQLVATPYCAGEQLSLADVYLIPQVFNARRFHFDMTPFPRIRAVCEACHQLEAFKRARPENQPDAATPPASG
jgi:maleylpyruvate isomerase